MTVLRSRQTGSTPAYQRENWTPERLHALLETSHGVGRDRVEVEQSSPHSESEGAKGTKTELQVQILELPLIGCVTKPH